MLCCLRWFRSSDPARSFLFVRLHDSRVVAHASGSRADALKVGLRRQRTEGVLLPRPRTRRSRPRDDGCPIDQRPGLVETNASTLANRSRYRPPFTSIPTRAALAIAAMITIGVASPSSAGEVTIRSATTFLTSRVTKKTTTRTTSTRGRSHAATLSASFLNWGYIAFGFFDQGDDSSKERVGPHFVGPNVEGSRFDNRSREDGLAGRL